MSKLLHNGVRGVMQRWFESYLSSRKQYVSIKNCSSSKSNITLGVKQGSVLGRVLFLLYINDMYRSLNQMCFVHFIDDTTVFASWEAKTVASWEANSFCIARPKYFLSTSVQLRIWLSPTRKMQLTLEFELKFLEKSQQSNWLALHLMIILLLMTM